MPSIHPDYEYDIFISYRQNDNRSDKWVSNFVEALKEELEAALKNPISIYFDENPHDGLLETHQVDASLAKKLKCLVFMPIISQTYCDETSFAWENEFMPFIKMAKEDKLGMNITLSNGNVVSRVLPVKIHRLDIDDQNTLEAVLDGPLRSIDFIYQEAGVNRPLKTDDDRSLNLEKTDYQNQINKVANALKDIGLSLLKQSDGKISVPIPERERPVEVAKSSKKGIYIGLAIIIIALLAYWGYKQFYNSPVAEVEDITIAVLAFDDQSPDGDQEWFGDGMADEILNVLAKVNGLQVTGKTSSFSFKGKGLTTKVIGEVLNVSTVLEGSVSKIGDKLRITAQLIDVETDKHIWSKRYDRDAADIFAIIDEVSQSIAGSLRSELSLNEIENIKIGYNTNPDAYEYYLKGVHVHNFKYFYSREINDFLLSEKMFLKALTFDSTYVDAYAGLADLYDSRRGSYYLKRDSIIDIGLRFDSNSPYLLTTSGMKFSHRTTPNFDSAFYFYKKAYSIDRNKPITISEIAYLYNLIGAGEIAIELLKPLVQADPLDPFVRDLLARAYNTLGLYEETKKEYLKILELDSSNIQATYVIFRIAVFYYQDKNEAERILEKIHLINPDSEYRALDSWILAMDGKKEEALSLNKGVGTYSLLGMKKEALNIVDSMSSVSNYLGFWNYSNLRNMKRLEFIREEPKFKEILAKAKVVYDERMAKYGHLFDEE